MPKDPKKEINKKPFDLEAFKKTRDAGLPDNINEEKELSWIPLSDAFHEAVRLPGIPQGYVVTFRGYSNTGKSTAMYEAVVGCQKLGILPVIYETEGNWNWEHAKLVGVEFTPTKIHPESGKILEAKGDFILETSETLYEKYKCYDHEHSKMLSKPLRFEPVVEDIAYDMHQILNAQEDGTLDRSVLFFWDSVGSTGCFKGAKSTASNNQWTAGALATAFKSLMYFRIPATRKANHKHTATFAFVNQIWLDNENKAVRQKGGESFWSGARLIYHYGGILSHGTEKIKATYNGAEYLYGTKVKILVDKNHVNGITQKGTIVSTPHGYWNPDNLEEYKKLHKDFIAKQLNMASGDFGTTTEGKLSD